jgi:hypothetical protein
MLILALLARCAGLSEANLVGDDLSIILTVVLIIFGAALVRRSPE